MIIYFFKPTNTTISINIWMKINYKGDYLTDKQKEIIKFIGKSVFYAAILLAMIYLYGYLKSSGGGFIYNDF